MTLLRTNNSKERINWICYYISSAQKENLIQLTLLINFFLGFLFKRGWGII